MLKELIEEKLEKLVQFMCWLYGDNLYEVYKMVKENGYLVIIFGKMYLEENKEDCIL